MSLKWKKGSQSFQSPPALPSPALSCPPPPPFGYLRCTRSPTLGQRKGFGQNLSLSRFSGTGFPHLWGPGPFSACCPCALTPLVWHTVPSNLCVHTEVQEGFPAYPLEQARAREAACPRGPEDRCKPHTGAQAFGASTTSSLEHSPPL